MSMQQFPATDVAGRLATSISEVAKHAYSEEDLRIGIEGLLKPALQELGISVSPNYERSYGSQGSILRGGRSDAVYGHLVIEYERVGALARPKGVQHAADQLNGYLQAEADREGTPTALRRSVGVGLDGQRIFFLRYRPGTSSIKAVDTTIEPDQLALFPVDVGEPRHQADQFKIQGPYSITKERIETFLLYLRALRRRPLTPEALADEFGPKGTIASNFITIFYATLTHTNHPKVQTFFNEWDRIFGIVYGQDLIKAKKDAHEVAQIYGIHQNVELKPLLFAVHTYYALLMKFLAVELLSLQSGSLTSSFVTELPNLDGHEMLDRLDDLENGGLFARLGMHNFLEGDFFGWYVAVWNTQLEESIRKLARALSDFEPATGSLEPEATRDLLKKLYQYLVPRELRHALGEYYTPDWLAELTLDEAGYDGNLTKRILDPSCGSGTFLVLAIRRAIEYASDPLSQLEPKETVRKIVANIVGFDLNPLAVIAARTNYLLALGTLVRHLTSLEIPIYLCDSVLTPTEQKDAQTTYIDDYKIPSTVGDFYVPRGIVADGKLSTLTSLLEECVKYQYSSDEFLKRAHCQVKYNIVHIFDKN